MLERVISGGQTGIDRAALDAAMEAGLPVGGWCPCGRLAEDGPIPEVYPLRETETADYEERTRRNVEDSDATLIITRGIPTGGTALTIEFVRETSRPCLLVDLATSPEPHEVRDFLEAHGVRVLNVAGPRESTTPGVYREGRAFLRRVFAEGD